jgi:hypothetical protein
MTEEHSCRRRANILLLWTCVALSVALWLLSRYVGVFDPDSEGYLTIAENVHAYGQCSDYNAEFVAAFPCGYPAIITITGELLQLRPGFTSMLTASHVVNFLLFMIDLCLARLLFKSYNAQIFILINPLVFDMYISPLSENVTYTSILGVLFCSERIYTLFCSEQIHAERQRRAIKIYQTLMFAFITGGLFSRYFSSPLLVVLACCSLPIYGLSALRMYGTPYALGFICFSIYLGFNYKLTGTFTGERVAAAESSKFIIIYFAYQMLIIVGVFLPMVAILIVNGVSSADIAGKFKRLHPAIIVKEFLLNGSTLVRVLIVLGIAHLCLQLVLRMKMTYDLFNMRLLGPGVVYIITSIIVYTDKGRMGIHKLYWMKVALVVVYCVFSGKSAEAARLAYSRHFVPAKVLIEQGRSERITQKWIFTFPSNGAVYPDIPIVPEYVFGANKKVIYAKYGPRVKADTLSSYRERVYRAIDQGGGCVFDFTQFNIAEELYRALSTKYDIDVDIFGLSRIRIDAYDRALVDTIIKSFKPRSLVDCTEILAQIDRATR